MKYFLLPLFVMAVFSRVFGAQPNETPNPWQSEDLSRAPDFKWINQTGEVHSLFYEGGKFNGKTTEVFAWYASPATLEGRKPKASDKFPGIVLLHGGAGTAFQEWARQWAARGYAVIAMDLSGRRADQNGEDGKPLRLENGGPDQNNAGTFEALRTEDFSDDWFHHALGNAVRAHSLLLSFREVDPARTAVTGISWGGILTCVVATVDPRFKAAVPVYGCGFLDQSNFMFSEFEALGPDLARRWYDAYDPARYLANDRTPIFFVNGTNDGFFPLDIMMKSYDAVSHAPKNLLAIPNFQHGHEPVWVRTEIAKFVDEHLKNGPALATVEAPTQESGNIQAVYAKSGSPIQSAVLQYAVKDGPINELKWQEVSATVEPGKVSAIAPDLSNSLYFFNLTDATGDIVSSPIVFPAAQSPAPNP